jgi:hypothetical protein
MIQQTDVFLRDFIGYHQHQITNLDIEWETHTEGFEAGYATSTLAGSPVLVYRAPDGSLRSKPLTDDALHRYRDALLADLQQLGSLASVAPSPVQSHRRTTVYR